MPSVVVLNYGFEKELPIGGGAGPQTTEGDLTRVYEGIPFDYDELTCTGSLFGTATVMQANHGLGFPYLQNVAVEVDDGTEGETNSTGGYQIKGVLEGIREVLFTKSGFFDLEMEATVECGKETKLDPELICHNPLIATVTDTGTNPIPGATVSATTTFATNLADKTDTKSGKTNSAGVASFNVAGGKQVVVTASAAGHDPATCTVTGVDGVDVCLDTYTATCALCKWNTIVGTVQIGDPLVAAEGYRLDLVDMSVSPPVVVHSDTTTAAGVFSLEKLSKATGTYRVNLYNTTGIFIGTTGNFTVTTCGATRTLYYKNGVWSGTIFP